MTEFLTTAGGRLAYDVTGAGPLIVLSHGMGDNRHCYRELTRLLVAAGYRVAAADLRGHGDSGIGWPSYTRTDIAADLLTLVRELGGPAAVVGHSAAGGAATIAAAQAPELVSAIVEINPFTRAQQLDFRAMATNSRYRKGMTLLIGVTLLRSVRWWKRYLELAFPGERPAGFAEHVAGVASDLRRPGRMAVVSAMGRTSPADAGARLGDIQCRALVVMGNLDPDWPNPRIEGERVVAAMPDGLARLELIDGAGHYPHVQYPSEVAASIVDFMRAGVRG